MRIATALFVAASGLLAANTVNADYLYGTMNLCNERVPSADNMVRECPSDAKDVPGAALSMCSSVPLTFKPRQSDGKPWTGCLGVPDFNAKGDVGSCGSMTSSGGFNPTDVSCTFYEDPTCPSSSSHKLKVLGSSYDLVAGSQPNSIIYRGFVCVIDGGDD